MSIDTHIFDKFPVLKTERLTLREILPSDAEKIYKMRANGRVNQFIARLSMPRLEDAVTLVEKTRMAYQNKLAIGWAGVLRENEAIIGTCGYNFIDFQNLRAEIGGELSVEYWGKNIALEAVMEVIRFGLNVIGLHSIEAKVSPDNRGAIYLLEYLGFRKEAHYRDRIYFKGQFWDMAVYSLIKGEERLEGEG